MKETIKLHTRKRVSDNAADTHGEILETFAGDVSEEVLAITKQDGRKTVRAEDVRKALQLRPNSLLFS
jgi:histone H3/H4